MSAADRIFAVVLAAGESSRFGETKQLALFDGQPLVFRAARTAADACGERTALVVGHEAPVVADAAAEQCRFLLVNDRYRDGMASSLALAAAALAPVADAILVMLADQPLVTPTHIRDLIRSWSGKDDEIVATSHGDAKGPPVLLPRATFESLQGLSGDQGARALFFDDRFRTLTVPFEPAGIDIDTRADIDSLDSSA